MKPIFQKMLIIGVGLIGGSLALAARSKGLVGQIMGMGRSEDSLKKALELGVLDQTTMDLKEGLMGTDLVVLATPVGDFEDWAHKISQHSIKGLIVTDVGSVKGNLVMHLEEILGDQAIFVGGHPIAGSEKSGVAASRDSLFEGARCILTPTAKTPSEALKRVQSLWEGIGSKVSLIDPFIHDRLLSTVSHLPHMVAYALVNTVMDAKFEGYDPVSYAGGGFRDFTRIAASSGEMWKDICFYNREALVEMIEVYQKNMEHLKQTILKGDQEELMKIFGRAKRLKERKV